jgi:hypothetical protein
MIPKCPLKDVNDVTPSICTSWRLERPSLEVLDKEKELWLLDYQLTNYFHVSLAHAWMTATSLLEGND